jgi:NADH:ubiquinone oxidoreductase subunit E|tara:strand:+ start:699 stop:962 length:264 start_codon:yes stop_codon:yes gene_type:complete
MSKKLNEEQLTTLQGLQEEFNKAKTEIADCEIKKASLIVSLSEIQKRFGEEEKALMEEFGENVIINLQTGEIKEPKKEEEKPLEAVK